MEVVMTVVAAILLVGLVVVMLIFGKAILTKIIITLSLLDTWWWPYKAMPPQGTSYVILDGSPQGPYFRLLESVDWRTYDEVADEFRGDRSKAPARGKAYEWVGFNKYLLWHRTSYSTWEEPAGATQARLVSKVRGVPDAPDASSAIFFQWNMGLEIGGSEIAGNYRINSSVQFTVHMIRTRQALFFGGRWESQVSAAIHQAFNAYVKPKTINDLTEVQAEGADSELTRILKSLNHGLLPLYGVAIVDAKLVKFDQIGTQEELAAASALRVATDQANAEKERGRGIKERMLEEAEGVRALVVAWGTTPEAWRLALALNLKDSKLIALGGDILAAVDTGGGGGATPRR